MLSSIEFRLSTPIFKLALRLNKQTNKKANKKPHQIKESTQFYPLGLENIRNELDPLLVFWAYYLLGSSDICYPSLIVELVF